MLSARHVCAVILHRKLNIERFRSLKTAKKIIFLGILVQHPTSVTASDVVHKVKITYPNRLSADEVGLATRLRCSAGAMTAFAGAGGPFAGLTCQAHPAGSDGLVQRNWQGIGRSRDSWDRMASLCEFQKRF